MHGSSPRTARIAELLHHHFLALLLLAYAAAAVVPAPGLLLRKVVFGRWQVFGEPLVFSLPLLLLGFLLLNAGLGVRQGQLGTIFRRPSLLVAGLLANALVPIGFIFVAARLLHWWHNPDEVQCVLLGLAVVAAMPVAGSSTAWSQNADGDLALSLGLVLGSTLLSPLTTPLLLRAVEPLTTADYTRALHALAGSGTGIVLGLCVVVPALAGLAVNRVAGEGRLTPLRPGLKVANSCCLLVLVYANAAVSLPESVANPDLDFVAVILGLVLVLCGTAFACGWLLGKLWGVGKPQQAALMFGLGMSNNGTGLALAALALADHPRVLLPVIFYNLIQHVVAGGVDRFMGPGSNTANPGWRPWSNPSLKRERSKYVRA